MSKCYSLGCSGRTKHKIIVFHPQEGALTFYCCKRHKQPLIESARFSGFTWEEKFCA